MFPYPNTAIEDQIISDPCSKKKEEEKVHKFSIDS